MEIWIDSADTEFLKEVFEYDIHFGITTNPSIIASTGKPPQEILTSILEMQDGPIAFQVTQNTIEGIVQEAKMIHAFSDRIIVKVPVTQVGLKAIRELSLDGVPIMATAILHPRQFLLACLAGADYCAPYFKTIADLGDDALATIESMLFIRQQYAFDVRLLVAGPHPIDNLTHCAELGVDAVTIKKDSFEDFIEDHPGTVQALEKFDADWKTFPHDTSLYSVHELREN